MAFAEPALFATGYVTPAEVTVSHTYCRETLSFAELLKERTHRLTELRGICPLQPQIMLKVSASQQNFYLKTTTTTAYSHLVCAFTCDFFLMGNVDAHDSCINNHFYPIKELITSPVAC